MRKFIGIIMVVALLSLLSPLLSSPVSGAIGISLGPSRIELEDALRGEVYERMIRVSSGCEDTATLLLFAGGDAGEWISFYDWDNPGAPIESVTIAGHDTVKVLVRFSIPEDAASGDYTATIDAESMPEAGVEGGQVGMKLRARANVTIEVTGEQILTGDVKSITARDVEVNYPLKIKVEFVNTGNVVAQPEIDVAISKDGTAIDSFTFAEAKVKVGLRQVIPMEWDTTGRELGDYLARTAVSLGGEVISTRELNFAILPVGTLSREGVLTELSLQGNPKLGAMAKIQATFFNTGQIDTKAKFIGEAYCDNELVDTLESEESLIPVGQEDTLTSYVKLERPGNYDIKGYINYEGKKTEVKEIFFALGEARGGLPFSLSTPFIIGVIVVLVAVIAVMALRRRRKAA